MLREDDSQTMTQPEMEISASIFMTAGSDTNASLISGCTYFVLQDRQIFNRLTAEIRGQFTKEEDMTFAALQKLPFLNAVLEETLRLYVTVPSTFSRCVPKEGATICGRWVPGGYTVGVNPYSSSLSEKNFRAATEFHPERWMGDERFATDDKKSHQPFSTGPRNCLGKNMAWAVARRKLSLF
jgi:cytochrome P450